MNKFRLEHILKYNRNIEDREKMALSIAMKNYQECQSAIQNLETELNGSVEQAKKLWQMPNIDIALIKNQNNFQIDLGSKLDTLKNKLADLSKYVEERRLMLVKASTKLKTIEHLKKRFIGQEQQRLDKIELDNLSEVAINRFIYQKQ